MGATRAELGRVELASRQGYKHRTDISTERVVTDKETEVSPRRGPRKTSNKSYWVHGGHDLPPSVRSWVFPFKYLKAAGL